MAEYDSGNCGCEGCNREFKVPLTYLSKTSDAQAYLQQQFDRHQCEVADAATHG
jgi:hypothetical protein